MNVFTSDSLEISLLSLQNVLMDNTSVSAVLVNGINSFYHQVFQLLFYLFIRLS